MTYRVVIVDPNVTQREGIRRMLEHDGFEIIAETGRGEDAVALAVRWRPDVVLMSVDLPDVEASDVLRHIMDTDPDQRVVLMGTAIHDCAVDTAIAAGAQGVLTTACTLRDVSQALARAADGEVVLAPSLTARDPLVRRPPRWSVSPRDERARLITSRERDVLQSIVDGHSCRDAAAQLFMSHKTLKNHLGSIYVKLQAHDRTQAVLTAVRLGIVTLR